MVYPTSVTVARFEFSPPTLPSVDLTDSLDAIAAFMGQLQGLVSTAVSHPLLSIAALLLGIGLLQLIADLVKRVIKVSLAFVLKLPLTISQWLWKRVTTATPNSKQTQIAQLIDRLDSLRQEQAQVLGELKALLSSGDVEASEVKPSSDKAASTVEPLPVLKEAEQAGTAAQAVSTSDATNPG